MTTEPAKKMDEESGVEVAAPMPLGTSQKIGMHDEVFGEITEEGPNYRGLGWKGTVVVMLKTQIGLGVLSVPQIFETLGLIPGVIVIIVVGYIISWSNYIVGTFKLRHPNVYGIEDVGRMMFGRVGYEFFGALFSIYWICTASASFIGLSTAFNALSSHATCTAVFVAVAAVIGFTFGSIQTLGRISWLAWIGITSICGAVLTLTISVGIQDRPSAAPLTPEPFNSDYVLFASPKPSEAFAAVSTAIFSFAGTPAFFHIVSEMRDPRMYTRSVAICQTFMIAIYVVIGVVVYIYCGSYVSTPALGSAGTLMKKVCYGLAAPGLMVSTALFVHFTAKYVFLRILRGSVHLTRNTPTHWAVWIGCTGGSAIIAYIVGSAIPILSALVSLVGAVGGTLMSMQPMGWMWLHDNWKSDKTAKWTAKVAWAVFVIVAGTFMTIAGTYGSVVRIIEDYKASGGSAAWSCADNSNSS